MNDARTDIPTDRDTAALYLRQARVVIDVAFDVMRQHPEGSRAYMEAAERLQRAADELARRGRDARDARASGMRLVGRPEPRAVRGVDCWVPDGPRR